MGLKIAFTDGAIEGDSSGSGPWDRIEYDTDAIRGYRGRDIVILALVETSKVDDGPIFQVEDPEGALVAYRRWTITPSLPREAKP